jgi:hypothetical protein
MKEEFVLTVPVLPQRQEILLLKEQIIPLEVFKMVFYYMITLLFVRKMAIFTLKVLAMLLE